MAELTMVQSINQTLAESMDQDENIIIMGEDVGHKGGVFNVTKGLQDRFGSKRIFNTPLNESGILGAAVGMALGGLRPVVEIQFQDFIFPGFDQLVSEMAKYRYRTGGQFGMPIVLRTPTGGGVGGGHYHSQSGEAYFAHTPGLYTVMPATPYDAVGLLRSAIKCNDPVLFLEPKMLYYEKNDIPAEYYEIPLGKARIDQAGDDVTIVTYGAMLKVCQAAVQAAKQAGINVELIDLRSIIPLDIDCILASVQKTGKLIVVNEAPKTGSFAAEIVAQVAEKALEYLEAPILRVSGYDTPFPCALEHDYLPDAERVLAAIDRTMSY